jgi:hypothetical protein
MVEIILAEPKLNRLKAVVPIGSDEHAALEAGDYFVDSVVTREPIAVTVQCTVEIAKRLLDAARTSCPDVVAEIHAAIEQETH